MVTQTEVVPYELFQVEASKISPIFGSEMIATHYLGGMILPGIIVKPLIELGIEVQDIEKIANLDLKGQAQPTVAPDIFTQQLMELGYTPCGEQGMSKRRFFTKAADPNGTYHLHVYQFGCRLPVWQAYFASSAMLMVWAGS
jgi:hypothetical protein